ncbi:efflux transporter outer membrane subunit [uncultured Dialister sp.]|uniref:efflux transporter outer membrane subunit n=1 Tax=uncultured Dialister sp. TaxID=278064 RepID=UPI00261F545D|nr:efflux transporter outer membrane subunit [uncultured Dialister sp.]
MDRRRKAALGMVSLLTAAFCMVPLSGSAADGVNLEKTPWTALAGMYDNLYFTEEKGASLTPEVLSEWWKVFHDDTLDSLIYTALNRNRDLMQAESRLKQAREALGMAKASLVPWMNAGAGWVRAEAPEGVISDVTPKALEKVPGMTIDNSRNLSYTGLDASWEPDFFGKNRAKVKASEKSLEARRGMLYSTWVSLSAEVAMNYITLRTLQEELAVTEAHIANQKDNLSLLQVNEKSGLISALPADQAAYTIHESEARVPELKTEIANTLNRISILTGTIPGELNEKLMTPSPLPEIDSAMYNAIPAEVLRQRPDVHGAEMAWAAQIAKTKEAKAEMKPKFSILGVLGLAALSGGLFSAGSHAFGIMPQVTYPLFNGGALKRNVRVQSEKEKEMQAAYENTVLKAAGEVRSAMTAVSQDKIRKDSLEKGRNKAKEALDLSKNQFTYGLSDYMGVLDAERHYLSLDQNYTLAKGKELTDMVALFKALGGGWKPLDEKEEKAEGRR